MTTALALADPALQEKLALLERPGTGSYLSEIFRMPTLTAEEEQLLAHEYRDNGNDQAGMALVCTHLRQVITIARGFAGYGLPEADLIQEGNLGLMKAVKRFDPERKVRLSTYAHHWIKSAIGEYIIRNWKIMKVATTTAQRKLFYRLRTITSRIGHRLTATDARAIADELEVKSSDVLEMEKRMLLPQVTYESTAVDDEFDNSPSATLQADDGAHAEVITIDNATAQTKHEALAAAIASLNDRERRIMEARAMSESGKDTKLHELAAELGISAERVRQLERNAMAKVKENVLKACAHLYE